MPSDQASYSQLIRCLKGQVIWFSIAWLLPAHGYSEEPIPPNVLFIAIDDLNDYALGLNAKFHAKTPCMQRLAERGTLFTNAHCAAPVCNPSRVSVLTGLSPSTSGVYVNKDDWRENDRLKSVVTLPQHFRDHGYKVIGGGKLYHAANLSQEGLLGMFDPRPWHEYFPSKSRQLPDAFVPAGASVNGSNKFYGGRFDWDALEIEDDEMGDGQVVTWAERQLSMSHTQPLFLSVGIYKPHIPWYTPKKWFEDYPLDSIVVPDSPLDDTIDLPDVANATTKHWWHQWLVENEKWAEATQAYLASASFADAMVGRLIEALERGPMADNTIVVLWSDHGYHLGHKQHWEKRVLWEQATHVPLIVVAPGDSYRRAQPCRSPVSLLDIYPTLSELCRLAKPLHLEGTSLVPQLRNPETGNDRAVVTTYQYKNHAVRSMHWRYISYADGSKELYDHRTDSQERNNLANDDAYLQTIRSLSAHLPKTNAPQENVRKLKAPTKPR